MITIAPHEAALIVGYAAAFAAGPVGAVLEDRRARRRRAFERALAITPGRALAVSHRAAPGRPPTYSRWRHRRPRTLPWTAWRLPLLPARRALTLVGAR
jgi:hypothetical protein